MHNGDRILSATILAIVQARRSGLSALRTRLALLRARKLQGEAASAELLADLQVGQAEINGSFHAALRALDRSEALGIVSVPISDDLYPATLRSIPDAPPVIHVRGQMDALSNAPGVAVVGTRNASHHGLTIAERIADYLSNAGFSVVSGLALGIDAAAHEGALKSNTPTIAVLAHGLEKASPRANAFLADRILEQGGAWISEHMVGTPARPEYFVQRNRIQVGLSCASIIVEGALKSGSMTQAEYCIRSRRTLFAVLPEVDSSVSTHQELSRMLVNDRGAIPIRSKADYSKMLELVISRRNELWIELGTKTFGQDADPNSRNTD